MGIQIIKDEADLYRLGIHRIQQCSDEVGPVTLGAPIRHGRLPWPS